LSSSQVFWLPQLTVFRMTGTCFFFCLVVVRCLTSSSLDLAQLVYPIIFHCFCFVFVFVFLYCCVEEYICLLGASLALTPHRLVFTNKTQVIYLASQHRPVNRSSHGREKEKEHSLWQLRWHFDSMKNIMMYLHRRVYVCKDFLTDLPNFHNFLHLSCSLKMYYVHVIVSTPTPVHFLLQVRCDYLVLKSYSKIVDDKELSESVPFSRQTGRIYK
jgi:hypothetical protein